MKDIPGLRLSPLRMIALVEQSGRESGSASPKPSPTERQAAGSSDRRTLAAKPLQVKERAITSADTTPATQTRAARAPSSHPERMEDTDDVPERDISFGDFLDIINPLQHIPIVGTIYRAITGDEISAPARIFGGFLFGGPLGFVTAIANAIFEEASGQDLGETALAALLGDDTAPDVQTAQTPSASSTTAPLEVATPTQDSQALAAATAPASTTQNAGDYLGPPENLTGQLALDAFVRDLRKSEQLARTALATANPGVPVAIQAQVPDARLLDPRTKGATLPASAFAERMLHALNKYHPIARKAERNGNDRGFVLDAQL